MERRAPMASTPVTKKRRRNLALVEHPQDVRCSAFRAEVGGRKRGRRGRPVAPQRRFRIVVKAEAHCDSRAIGPHFRHRLAADAGQINRLTELFVAPLRTVLASAALRGRRTWRVRVQPQEFAGRASLVGLPVRPSTPGGRPD